MCSNRAHDWEGAAAQLGFRSLRGDSPPVIQAPSPLLVEVSQPQGCHARPQEPPAAAQGGRHFSP